MHLASLCVFHLSKKKGRSFLNAVPQDSPETFYMETCQRWLWVAQREKFDPTPFLTCEGIEIYRGLQAYQFLLKLACGLESEVLGETDVFGQIKVAWRKEFALKRNWISELSPWFQRVFEDTKAIRTQHLQNLGGASYGTLVRRVIRDQQSGPKDPILIIGAGQVAQSIVPYFLESELWLWNRDSSRLESFYTDVSARSRSTVQQLVSPEGEISGWKNAAHIVVCIPVDSEKDEERLKWFLEGRSDRTIIHLGAMKETCGAWGKVSNLFCLNDLFSLQSSLGNVRSVQITQAERACEERAKLRALGSSLSICHGWEDLACFA